MILPLVIPIYTPLYFNPRTATLLEMLNMSRVKFWWESVCQVLRCLMSHPHVPCLSIRYQPFCAQSGDRGRSSTAPTVYFILNIIDFFLSPPHPRCRWNIYNADFPPLSRLRPEECGERSSPALRTGIPSAYFGSHFLTPHSSRISRGLWSLALPESEYFATFIAPTV